MGLTRRDLLIAGCSGSAMLACAFAPTAHASASDDVMDIVTQLAEGSIKLSDRVHLIMPAKFPTGYTVPMEIEVVSPMTNDDHVKRVRVFAPENPFIEVAGFNFAPQRSVARVSTRIRLAKPQFVVAVAEMNDGKLLAAKTWVDVASNGCT